VGYDGGVSWAEENPFNAGWGVAPPVWVGREEIFHRVLANLLGGPTRAEYITMILGARGVGKTVLLRRLRDYIVAEHAWMVMDWTAGPDHDFAEALGDRYPMLREQLIGRRARIDGGNLNVRTPVAGASIQIAGRAMPTTVAGRLRELGELAAERRTQVVLMVDEIQAATAQSLRQLAGAVQETNGAGLPIGLVAVGLPTVPSRFAGIADITFLERQRFHMLDNLSAEETRVALEQPFVDAGRRIDTAALRRLVSYTNGYPYAIQEVGHHTWDAAGDHEVVTDAHARSGIARSAPTFDAIFARRWEKLSPTQRAYMAAFAALADDNGSASTSEIAAKLGMTATTASKYRAALINTHQVLYPVARGRVATALPGFIHWVTAHTTRTAKMIETNRGDNKPRS